MKQITLLILMIFTIVRIQAQNYQISFAGTGSSSSVDSVKIENLTQCTDTVIGGNNVLNLTSTITGINEINSSSDNSLQAFPNPTAENCFIEFNLSVAGPIIIELFDIKGKRILSLNELLSKGHQSYILNGMASGVYLLNIKSEKNIYSAKIVCINTTSGSPKIKHISTMPVINEKSEISISHKSKSVIDMLFNANDTLKLTGKSGNFRTIVMLEPTQNQTVTFIFVNCTDADSNHYAVVQIGTQLWMAENLKATKYRDGSIIPNVPDSATWRSLTSGAYCNYHDDPAEGQQYGRLYNWYAAADNRNIAPVGWHVSTNSEWNIMEKFLDATVDTTALGGTGKRIGRILKEGCITRWQYQDSTSGINSSGFTALCANYRNSTGAWSLAPNNNHDDGFWTSTSYNTSAAWYRSLRWCFGNIYSLFPMKKSGNSIRCVHD
jgi:uncharacterized protein (TIGR02145 family)